MSNRYANNSQKADPPGLVLSLPSEQVLRDISDHDSGRNETNENSDANDSNDLVSSEDSTEVQHQQQPLNLLTVTPTPPSNFVKLEPFDDEIPTSDVVVNPSMEEESVEDENESEIVNELTPSEELLTEAPISSDQQLNGDVRDSIRSTSSESSNPSSISPPGDSMSTKPTNPGGYRVTKIRPPGLTKYQVLVPAHVQPGTDFTVEIPELLVNDSGGTTSQNRRVQVTCPTEDVVPGVSDIEILVPAAATYRYRSLKAAQLTIAPTTSPAVAGKAFAMLPSINRINQQAMNIGGTIRTQVITIPDNAVPGKEFKYYLDGYVNVGDKKKRGKLKIPCPLNCNPGDRLRIVLPAEIPEPEPLYQTFMVVVPDGAIPGGHFAVEIGLGNQQVLVECPQSSKPGDTISIQLPTRTVVDKFQALTYPSTGTGWKRTVRISDLHFQWVRLEESIVRPPKRSAPSIASYNSTESTGQPSRDSSINSLETTLVDWTYYHEKAYVRKLVQLEGNDPRLRTGLLTLVSAELSSSPSRLKTNNGILLFSYADIANQQGQPLQSKHAWFLDVCQRLSEYASTTTADNTNIAIAIPPNSTMHQSIRILVRREHLLPDSLRAILSLSSEDMRRPWEIEFVGEKGIDQGGPTKEWLQCVTEEIFHPSTGLFLPSLNNQAAVDINPVSDVACPHYHLLYYRFVGRVLGRALFSGQLIRGHFVRLLYKHILGWPITIEDIRDQDDGYYSAIHELMRMDDKSLTDLSIDFTVSEEYGDARIIHELIENGANTALCRKNLTLYIESNIRYRLFDRIRPQLTELLLGFYDVVPEQALAVFDANELELVLCGVPQIDVDDWQSNTVYVGLFANDNELAVQWFWEIVRDEYDIEMRARLLQFVTGTSGVPPGGFSFLKGSDDSPRKFTIQGVDPLSCHYPKAHTCFNVLDLPYYRTKNELQQRLTFSITTSFVGFESE